MWYALIVIAMISTALTRLVSFYYGISAIAYIAVVPLFAMTTIFYLLVPRKNSFRKMDLAVLLLVLMPIIWTPISVVMAYETSPSYPMNQFFKQIIWSLLVYSPYFAVRYIPLRRPAFVFWAFCTVVAAAVPVIYLQQVGILGQFYTPSGEANLSRYLDQFGDARFRNTGFFGYAHDAGEALLLLLLALYSCAMSGATQRFRRYALAAMPFVFIAVVLTSSRASVVLSVIAIGSGLLFIEPLVWGRLGLFIRNMIRLPIFLVVIGLVFWVVIEMWPGFFSTTLLFSTGLSFLTGEGRADSALTAFAYLLSDPVRAFFGWGLGTGGLASIQGEKLLPVNLSDTTLAITLANFGLFGVLFIATALVYMMRQLARVRRQTTRWAREGLCDPMLPVISQFCILALFVALLSCTVLGDAVTNRVFCNFTFLCLGALINTYDRRLSSLAAQARTNTHVAAVRAA